MAPARRRPHPVVLVRHAQTDWNEGRIAQGQLDAPRLTDEGLRQAGDVAMSLAGAVDTIVSSDLTRARQTARIISEALGIAIELDPALRERSFGALEGGPLAGLTAEATGIVDGRVADVAAAPPEGESLTQLFDRVAGAAERIRATAASRRVLVVTHGGAIRMFRAYCSGTSLRGLAWDAVGNCSRWTVELPDSAPD